MKYNQDGTNKPTMKSKRTHNTIAKKWKNPRPRKQRDPSYVMNGIFWILQTGSSWKDLPPRYPPYQTCPRRFQQ
jgi:transposase